MSQRNDDAVKISTASVDEADDEQGTAPDTEPYRTMPHVRRHSTTITACTNYEDASLPARKRQKVSGVLRCMLRKVRTDWATLMAIRAIQKGRHSRMKGADCNIKHVMCFLFHPNIKKLLSWSSILLKCGTKWIVFRGIIRNLSTEHIWRAYTHRAAKVTRDESDICGRTVMLKLVRTLTGGEQKRGSSVDCILRPLIYDNMEAMEIIVDLEVNYHSTKTTLKKRFHAGVELMEFYYAAHVVST